MRFPPVTTLTMPARPEADIYWG
ncbi:hypothetical protein SCOCK_570005 [Actinacidiphila cocklensis]|uniref:Uncharacterized protein n=1 Tax=Actinacidiphila cocklensis TaxID=887465 RepID=A0A9W4E141_9ACTN|nr:hypothetical protein SCOCK_570005 [Actinacidiphila cocklensis]